MTDFYFNNYRLPSETTHNHGLISHLISNPFCPMQSTAHLVANVVFHILLFPLGIVRIIYFIGRTLFSNPSQTNQAEQQQLQTMASAVRRASLSAPPVSFIESTLAKPDIFAHINSFLSPSDTANLQAVSKATMQTKTRLQKICKTQYESGFVDDKRSKYILKVIQSIREKRHVGEIPVFNQIEHFTSYGDIFGSIMDEDLALLSRICPNLKYLHLPHSPISNLGLLFLKGLPLRHLDLARTKVTDEGLFHLRDLPLQFLDLSYTQISNDGLKYLKNTPLQSLWIHDTKITDQGLAHLRNMPIRRLCLPAAITDVGLSYLKGMLLTDLRLHGTQVTNVGLAYLEGMPLEFLVPPEAITDEGLSFLKDMPLKTLLLTSHSQITDAGLKYLEKMPLSWISLPGTVSEEARIAFHQKNKYVS